MRESMITERLKMPEVIARLNIKVPKGHEVFSFSVPTRNMKDKPIEEFELVVKMRKITDAKE